MKTQAISIVLTVLLAAPAQAAPPAASAPVKPPAGHPLVGSWRWTRTTNGCTETYAFGADGRVAIASGAERTDNLYTVTERPDADGFYRLDILTLRDRGGRDCGDSTADSAGQTSTAFIRFDAEREHYIVCHEPRIEVCFGPLERVRR